MTPQRKQHARLLTGVLLVSLAGWIALLTGSAGPSMLSSTMCGDSASQLMEAPTLGHQAGNWVLMLVAMMLPTLVPPVYFIWQSSFARIRVALITLFFTGFGLVWLLVGAGLTGLEFFARSLAPPSWSWLPAIVVALAALVWQASPGKQICLNRCQSHPPLAAFGFAAGRDALKMGLVHGMWCAGSCWAAMLFPMVLPTGHHAAMAAVTVLMFCERMDPAARPSWRWRGFRTSFLWMQRRFRGWQPRVLLGRHPATAEAPWQASNTA